MSKPKVSTKAYSKQNKIDKIISVLAEHPEGLFPKQIGFLTKINVNTIKSFLPKIPIVAKKDGMRGIYILVDKYTHGSIFKWNLHNAIISYEVPEYNGERIKKTLGFNLVNFEFEVGAESKRATLRLSTDYPINISSLEVYYLLFVELVKTYCEKTPSPEETYVSSIEFNQDFVNLRLDGMKCITLNSLLSQFKAYQKKMGLRVEYKTKIQIGVNEIFSMLESSPYHLEVYGELRRIKERQEILIDSHKKLYGFMEAILKKIQNVNSNG